MSTVPGAAQTVLVTAVPRGYRGLGVVEVGAVVSPRLSYPSGHADLGDFPDWVTWHQQTPTWEISFSKGASWLPATVLSERSTDPLWPDLFPETTRVASYDGDPGPQRTALGYSYATLADAVAEAYQVPDLADSRLADAVSRGLPTPRPSGTPTADVADAVAQYLGFWKPVGDMTPARGELEPDFHERISLLADHPGFLESLGLVVRLAVTIPRSGLTGTVRARLVWSPASGVPTTVVSPDTRVDRTGGRYAPALRTSDGRYDDRLRLALQQAETYSVHSLDVDASVAQLISVVRGRQSPTTAAPSVPSARGGGLTLAMTGRVQQLQDRLTKGRQTALAARSTPASPPTVFAEDLIVGHHLQVGTGPADAPPDHVQWYGLGHRRTRYVTARARWEVVDEAPVTLVARRQDPAKAEKVLVSDVITRWDGWSLAVPHPAHSQLLQEDPTGTAVASSEGRPGITSLTFTTSMPEVAADGSDPRLPALRYGHVYRFRGRAVDLTGGAPAWDDAPSTRPTTYWRWEAAAAPLVLPPEVLTRTEDALRVVVRSDPRAGVGPGPKSSRTIAPPRVSVDTGLRHGLFDRPDGTPRPDAFALLRGLDRPPPDHTDPPSGNGYPRPLLVSWLPDPMTTDVHLDVENLSAREASFVPASDPDPLGVATIDRWFGLGLVLVATKNGAASELGQVEQLTQGSRLRVELRPGARARVAVRTALRERRAAEHGVVDLLPGTLEGKLERLARESVPAVNPERFVELVHAVKQPLRDPVLESATADRPAGRQNPVISTEIAVEAETSGRVTVVAGWSEWQDSGPALRTSPTWSAPVRKDVERTALLDADLAPVDTPPTARIDLARYQYAEPLVLPDLRRRDVRLTVTATSRFVEEFRTAIPMTFTRIPSGTGPRYLDRPADVDLESITLSVTVDRGASAGTRRLSVGRDYDVAVHPTSGLRTLRLSRSYDEELPDVEGVQGTVLATGRRARTVIVPSAVRPVPPKLVHALPAWVSQDGVLRGDGTATASRGGSLLRLYLERPWWSSGDGEQLAVVTGHDHQTGGEFQADGSLLSRAVTLYGLDPALRVTSGTPRVAPLSSGTTVAGLDLVQDLGTTDVVRATIAAHDVSYHAERDLYVAELAFPDKPAGTFVRLAVARYQPHVGDGVPHLSPVVTLDPVQLLPRRSVLVRNQGSQLRVSVSGSVHAGPDADRAPRLRATLQQKVRRDAGPDLGWETVQSEVVVASGPAFPVVYLQRGPGVLGSGYRVLVEELEYWPTPAGANPAYVDTLISTAGAVADLVGERVTWVASVPLPTN